MRVRLGLLVAAVIAVLHPAVASDSVSSAPAKPAAAAVRQTLFDQSSTRESRVLALSSATLLGKDAAPILLDFYQATANDKSWEKPVNDAMCKVLDRRLLEPLSKLAGTSEDDAVRVKAITSMGVYVSQSFIVSMVPTKDPNRFAYVIYGGSWNTSEGIASAGTILTLDDRKIVRATANAMAGDPKASKAVRNAANKVLDRMNAMEAAEAKGIAAAKAS